MNTRKWFRTEKNTVYPDPMESRFDEEPLLQTDCHPFPAFDGNTLVLSELPGVTKQGGKGTKSRFICRQPSGSDRCERLKEHVPQIRSRFGNYTELKDNRLCTIVRSSEIPIYGFRDTDTDITYISASDHIKWSCPNSPKPTLTGNVRRHGANPVDVFELPFPTSQTNSLNHSQKHGMIARPKLPLNGVSSCNQNEDNSPKRLRVTGNDMRDSQSAPVANSVKLSSTASAWNELDIPKQDTDGIIRSVVAIMSASLKRTVLVRKLDLRRKRPRICVRWLGCSHSQPQKEPGSFELQVCKAAEPSAQICIEVACKGCRAHSHVGLGGRYFPTSVRSRNSARTLRRVDRRNLRNGEEEDKSERFYHWEARRSYQKICRSKTDCCTPSETDVESTHHHSIRHTSSVVTLTNESVACHSSSSSFNLTCYVDRRAHSADKRCEFNCGSHSTPGQKNSFEEASLNDRICYQAERTANHKPNWKRIVRPCWFKIPDQLHLQVPTSEIIVVQQNIPETVVRFNL
ncbi:hypothetical protein P879_07858 [Paragonimus westermani]|uniref:Uncharacterized protein n=1 Tax=Paragonimus westermani TaxID=34504 RepID=A0A8T0DID8_9TREM|nr:hypothetical protein P879_07858 [Paragonimus westermani]